MRIEVTEFVSRASELIALLESQGIAITITRENRPIAQVRRTAAPADRLTDEQKAALEPLQIRWGTGEPLGRPWEPIDAPGTPLSELVIADREDRS